MLNVQGCGRLGSDPEVFEFQTGTTVVKLFVICKTGYDSQKQEDITTAISVTLWGKYGGSIAKNLAKGDQVIFSGTLSSTKSNDGITYYNVDVSNRNFEFGKKKL